MAVSVDKDLANATLLYAKNVYDSNGIDSLQLFRDPLESGKPLDQFA